LTSSSAAEADLDDDDLLSSGQVSPIGMPLLLQIPLHLFNKCITENQRPSPFNVLHDGQSGSTLHTTNTEYERKVTEFNQKRPWGNRVYQSRVSSWADPVSARDILDGDEENLETSLKRRSKGKSRLAGLVGSEVVEMDEPEEVAEDGYESVGERSEGGEDAPRRRATMYGPHR
jgi:hypothetical protein